MAELNAWATVTGAYASKLKVASRLIPALDLSTPSVMSSPPTFATSGPGGASPINGGSPTQIAYNDARITHLGCIPTKVTQFSTDYWANNINGSWTPPACAVEFDFYGDDLAMRFRCATTNQTEVWVWVDGHPATAAPVILSANTSGGSLSFYRITFGSVAMRRIRIYRYKADFGGIDIKPTHAIGPVPRTAPKLFVLGDSYIEGTGSTSQIAALGMTVGRLLGMETFVAGQGGTGYANAGGGGSKAAYTDSTRLAGVASASPDYVVVFGSQNDDGLSGIQTAAASVYSALASSLPSAKLIVVGRPSLGTSQTANALANRTAVQTAAQAAGNVLGFVDPLSDEQGVTWINGSGNSGSLAGDGNADLFTSSGASAGHPTQAGHDYYARRMARAIAALLAAA